MQDQTLRRKSARVRINWPAVLLAGPERTPCAIVDLSLGGARLDVKSGVREKSYVVVLCPKFGSLDGQVVWRNGQHAGIKFTDPGAMAALGPFVKSMQAESLVATVKFGRRKA